MSQISEAKPITPPKAAETRGSYQCIVDYNSTPFRVRWSGSSAYPDLGAFPACSNPNIEVTRIVLQPELGQIWARSILHDFGTHASIRITDDDTFPILKLAHPDDDFSLRLIDHEFNVLAEVKKLGIPTVDFDPRPITCDGVIYGYRMKALVKLEPGEIKSRSREVEDAIRRLHSSGFCHGDFNPSNIMKNEYGQLVLIDFSFAGRIDSLVPSFIPTWRFPTGRYCPDVDSVALGMFL